jgi:hypothetical protein
MTNAAPLLCVMAALAWCCPATGRGEEPAPPASSKTTLATASGASQSPTAALAALDPRRPLPLQPMMAWHQKQNMMEHLVAIQHITEALARDDWDEVVGASARIGTSPEMQMMCRHMGAAAVGFTDMALDFHRRADAIGDAARAQDKAAVLRATANTLRACTSCHAVFRQEVVDAATWQERTGHAHGGMGVD